MHLRGHGGETHGFQYKRYLRSSIVVSATLEIVIRVAFQPRILNDDRGFPP